MKEGGNYFSHDYGARNDPKLLELQMEMGGQGLAIWWCLVEMLWENGGYLPKNFKSIAFSLHWATADEVRKVVEGFELFQWDDEKFWNNSALGRIEKRKKISESRAGAGRASGASRRANAEQPGDQGEQVLNKCSTSVEQVGNKEINKEKNNQRNFSIPPSPAERKRLFEIFFFENFRNPTREVGRFVDHYAARGWIFSDGKPVVDMFAAAKNWKPEDGLKNRYPGEFISWYKMVVNGANGRFEGRPWMVQDLVLVQARNRCLDLTYKTRSECAAVKEFVQGNNLDTGWEINWSWRNE